MACTLLLKQYQVEDVPVSIYEPDSHEVLQQYQAGLIAFPYWSQVWPAAIALSRFLLRYPHYTQGKHVLELAAGLGLPAVVAARNAASVIGSDYVEDAVAAMQQTVMYNGLQNMQVQLLDWYALPPDLTTDVLLLSDVSYDAALFIVQEKVIRMFMMQGSIVIISTPQRLIAKEAIAPILNICTHQQEISVLHDNTEVSITVLVLQLTN